ncbi:MAG TPA: hypothetical protein V6D19_00490 [Stenomitos sp.]
MGMHCPTCSCASCEQKRWYTSADLPEEDKIIWRRNNPNYPGQSYEGSQAVSHVTQKGNSQTFYVDDSLPPQNIRGFQQTYHRTNSQQWERIPDSPLPEEAQRQVNSQLHGLAEQLRKQYGAQNVQVHQAFIQPHQLTPELISKLPPEQQVAKQGQLQQQIQQQPKQGFWDRLRGRQPEQTQSFQSVSEKIIQVIAKTKSKSALGGLVLADGSVTVERNLTPKNPVSFRFRWRDKAAIGFWHFHEESKGHPPTIGKDDIRVAQESGLSCYMIFKGRNNGYQFAEYHPQGAPTTRPIYAYDLCLNCPTDIQQLNQVIDESNAFIKEENARYRKEVEKANQKLREAQQQTLKDINQAALATQNLQDKSRLFANKYQMIGANHNVNLESVVRRPALPESRAQRVLNPGTGTAAQGGSTREKDYSEVHFQGHRPRYKDFA